LVEAVEAPVVISMAMVAVAQVVLVVIAPL
jgi:hypothetical protein